MNDKIKVIIIADFIETSSNLKFFKEGLWLYS